MPEGEGYHIKVAQASSPSPESEVEQVDISREEKTPIAHVAIHPDGGRHQPNADGPHKEGGKKESWGRWLRRKAYDALPNLYQTMTEDETHYSADFIWLEKTVSTFIVFLILAAIVVLSIYYGTRKVQQAFELDSNPKLEAYLHVFSKYGDSLVGQPYCTCGTSVLPFGYDNGGFVKNVTFTLDGICEGYTDDIVPEQTVPVVEIKKAGSPPGSPTSTYDGCVGVMDLNPTMNYTWNQSLTPWVECAQAQKMFDSVLMSLNSECSTVQELHNITVYDFLSEYFVTTALLEVSAFYKLMHTGLDMRAMQTGRSVYGSMFKEPPVVMDADSLSLTQAMQQANVMSQSGDGFCSEFYLGNGATSKPLTALLQCKAQDWWTGKCCTTRQGNLLSGCGQEFKLPCSASMKTLVARLNGTEYDSWKSALKGAFLTGMSAASRKANMQQVLASAPQSNGQQARPAASPSASPASGALPSAGAGASPSPASVGASAGAGAAPSPASVGASPSPASVGASPSPASAGASPSPAGAGASPSPASSGASPSPTSSGAPSPSPGSSGASSPSPASIGGSPSPASSGTSPSPASSGTSPSPASSGTSPSPAPSPASSGTSPSPASSGTSPSPAGSSSSGSAGGGGAAPAPAPKRRLSSTTGGGYELIDDVEDMYPRYYNGCSPMQCSYSIYAVPDPKGLFMIVSSLVGGVINMAINFGLFMYIVSKMYVKRQRKKRGHGVAPHSDADHRGPDKE